MIILNKFVSIHFFSLSKIWTWHPFCIFSKQREVCNVLFLTVNSFSSLWQLNGMGEMDLISFNLGATRSMATKFSIKNHFTYKSKWGNTKSDAIDRWLEEVKASLDLTGKNLNIDEGRLQHQEKQDKYTIDLR